MQKPERRIFTGQISQDDDYKDGYSHAQNQTRGQGSLFSIKGGLSFPQYRLIILCLLILDFVLLLAAIIIGVYCSTFSGASPTQHSAATPFVIELHYLKSNHSEIIKAKEEAQKALMRELNDQAILQKDVEKEKTQTDALQFQIERLRADKAQLEANKTALEESCGECPSGFLLLNSSCYFFSYSDSDSEKKSWPDSQADCKNRGADLVVINDWEEQQLLSYSLPRTGSSGPWWSNGFWIGLTDIAVEGTWVWVNNVTQLAPFYWVDGEPNNHGEQGENCAATYYRIGRDVRQTWYDGKCNHHQYHWICEVPIRSARMPTRSG